MDNADIMADYGDKTGCCEDDIAFENAVYSMSVFTDTLDYTMAYLLKVWNSWPQISSTTRGNVQLQTNSTNYIVMNCETEYDEFGVLTFNRSECFDVGMGTVDFTISNFYYPTIAADGVFVSGVYYFDAMNMNTLGITIGAPIHDSNGIPCGIAAVDYDLNSVSKFIANLELDGGGIIILAERDTGYIIGTNRNITLHTTGFSGKLEPTRMWEASDEYIEGIADLVLLNFDSLNVENPSIIKGKVVAAEYYVTISNVGTRWSMVVAIPSDVFNTGIESRKWISILTTLGVVIISVIISVFISMTITRPLIRLTKVLNAISNLNLQDDESFNSHSSYSEFNVLQSVAQKLKRTTLRIVPFLSIDVLRYILSENRPLRLGRCVIMFVDVKGFSEIADQKGEDATGRVRTVLTGFFDDAIGAIGKHKGVVDKMIGDCVMGVWGLKNDAVLQDDINACRAALDIQKALVRTRAIHQKYGDGIPLVYARVGLSVGNVLVGESGTGDELDEKSKRTQFTVIGSVVNKTARLETACKMYGVDILVSEALRVSCFKHFGFRSLGKMNLKGISEPESVYELGDEISEKMSIKNKIFGQFNLARKSMEDGDWESARNYLEEYIMAQNESGNTDAHANKLLSFVIDESCLEISIALEENYRQLLREKEKYSGMTIEFIFDSALEELKKATEACKREDVSKMTECCYIQPSSDGSSHLKK
jgi:class 3 adenylate cyclase